MGTREDILSTAQSLFFSKGYDNTSIQLILNHSGIAKGTFYHYFKSKDDLLCEIVSLFSKAALMHAQYILNSDMSALEKLNRFYDTGSKYKLENIDKVKSITFALYSKANLPLRDKLYKDSIDMVVPIITQIVNEGMNNGEFGCSDAGIGEIIHMVGLSLNNKVGSLMVKGLETEDKESIIVDIITSLKLYNFSIENMLEIPHGSLHLFDEDGIRQFLIKLYS